jgi:hypothetical protein
LLTWATPGPRRLRGPYVWTILVPAVINWCFDCKNNVRSANPMSRYQREEALSNPCRSMPVWQDALVASVARLTDEMLERAVIIGFLGTWLCDRAVEAGANPYDATDPAKFAAIVAVCIYLEVRLRRSSKRLGLYELTAADS